MALHQLFFISKQANSVLKTLLLSIVFLGISLSPLVYSIAYAQAPGSGVSSGADSERNRTTLVTVDGFCDRTNWLDWDLAECASMRLLQISSYALIQAGVVFNFFLDLTLDTGLFKDDGVVSIPWTSIKDLANIGFILALIFISFKLIFEGIETNAKKVIVRLIIAALLINFSMFFSRVLIDAGNITALTFKNQITITESTGQIANIQSETGGFIKGQDDTPPQDIAGAIIASFNPLRIFKGEVFKSLNDENGDSQRMNFAILIIFLAMSIIQLMLAWEFIKAGFYFISRTVWLVVLTVISPLAFVSLAFPKGKERVFDKWLKNIIDRCFCVVIFVAAVWLLILMMNTIGNNTAAGDTWQGVITTVVLQFGLVYGLIKVATAQTKKMCEGGVGVGDFAIAGTKKIGGFGLGVATGGAGVLARGSIGRFASNTYRGRNAIGKRLARAEEEGGLGARLVRRGMESTSLKNFGTGSSFEKRRDKAADERFKRTNVLENINKGMREKEYEEKYMAENLAKGMSEKAAKKAAVERAGREASEESRVRADRTLEARAGTKGEDGKPLGGPISRLTDWVAAGATNAADEALARRRKSEDQDKQRREAKAQLAGEREARQLRTEAQVREIEKASLDTSKETMDEFINALKDNQPIVDFQIPIALQNAMEKAYARTDDEGVIKTKPDGTPDIAADDKAQMDGLISGIKNDVGSALRSAAEKQRELYEALETNVSKLAEAERESVQMRNDAESEQQDVDELRSIIEEMNSSDDSTATLAQSRRDLLQRVGIAVPTGATSITPDLKDNLITVEARKQRNISGMNANLRDTELEIKKAKDDVRNTETQIKENNDETKQEVREALSYGAKTARAKARARSKAAEIIEIARVERVERDSRQVQDKAGDISNEDQSARETDFKQK